MDKRIRRISESYGRPGEGGNAVIAPHNLAVLSNMQSCETPVWAMRETRARLAEMQDDD